MQVSLREITAQTVRRITDLQVAANQSRFVASNAVSLAEALFYDEAWYRAIYCGEAPAGFVMLYDETLRAIPPTQPQIFLWRLMIDVAYQGRGLGRAALELVTEYVISRGLLTFRTSYVPGAGCPEPFYRAFGFEPTGEIDDGEVVLRLDMAKRLQASHNTSLRHP